MKLGTSWTNLQHLLEAIVLIWTRISIECFKQLVESVAWRLQKAKDTQAGISVSIKVASTSVIFYYVSEVNDSTLF